MKASQIQIMILFVSLLAFAQNVPAAMTNIIGPGDIKYGSIIEPNQSDFYSFEANAGDFIYLTLIYTKGPGYPWFYFWHEGQIVPGTVRQFPLVIWSQPAPETGTYVIEVTDDSHEYSYDYVLTLTIINANNRREDGDGPESLVFGGVTGGHISVGDFDTFTFIGKSNDAAFIQVVLTNGPADTPFFYMYGPDGQPFDRGSSVRDRALWNGRLPQDGQYTVGVIHQVNVGEFDYTIAMVKAPGTNFPETGEDPFIQSGQTSSGFISRGDLDGYSFYAIAGDSLKIKLSLTSGSGAPYMYLYNPDGEGLYATNGSEIRIPCATNTGIYTVLIINDVSDSTFGYDLGLTLSPGSPPSFDPDHPTLTIFRCETDTILRWPTNAANFGLQYKTNLSSSIPWVGIAPPYSVIANHYYVTNQSAHPTRFFRLARPNDGGAMLRPSYKPMLDRN